MIERGKKMKGIGYFAIMLGFLSMLSAPAPAKAGELKHQFIKPSFGGSPFLAQPLVNKALAQRDPQETTRTTTRQRSLQEFQDRLDRSILNRLATRVVTSLFGEEGLPTGDFSTGTFEINVTEGADDVTAVITDKVTGDTTEVIVPLF